MLLRHYVNIRSENCEFLKEHLSDYRGEKLSQSDLFFKNQLCSKNVSLNVNSTQVKVVDKMELNDRLIFRITKTQEPVKTNG